MRLPAKRAAAALLSILLLAGCMQEDFQTDEDFLPDLPGISEPAQEELIALPGQISLSYYARQPLDPITCPDGPQQTIGALLYEGLFQLDETFSPQPLLCERFSYNPENLTYVFTLRSDVAFSDGSPLTASDVAVSLNRARASQRYGARFSEVDSVTASDGAVTIRLIAPNTAFPALLDIPIVKKNSEDPDRPLGTGPYACAFDEGSACLVANPFWSRHGTQPVERINLLPAQDEDSLLYQFTSHETQFLCADPTGSTSVSVTGSVDFQDADTSVMQYIGINVNHPLLSSASLREALGEGFDRQQIVSALLSGHGTAAQFPISPVSPEYPKDLEHVYSYDRFEQAMSRPAFVDREEPAHLTMLVNEENSFKVTAARAIAASLSAFDLRVDVRLLPWEEFTAALEAGDFELYYGEVKLTADWDLRPLLSTGGALNYGGYSSATTDQLLADCGAYAQDRAAARAALCRWIQKSAPILPICFKSSSVLVQTGVAKLTPTASNPFYGISELEFHLAGQ